MKPELEELPSRASNKLRKVGYERGSDVPYARIKRWICSKVGENFDSVLSQWVKLEWLPVRLRNYTKFKLYIETEVIIDENGKFYYSGCFMGRLIESSKRQIVFVNPKDNKVTISKPIKRENWMKKREEELSKRFVRIGDYHQYCKIDGIWYEVILKDHFFITRYDPVSAKCYQVRRNIEKNTPLTDLSAYKTHYRRRFFVEKREQLNSKKLKEFELTND